MKGEMKGEIRCEGELDPCLIELGLCLICGLRSEFNWSSMIHEGYGLWWIKNQVALRLGKEIK